jgi:hypothetical protein
MKIHLLGRPRLDDAPGIHQHDTIRDGEGLLLIVGDMNGRDAHTPLEPPYLHAKPLAYLGVEIAERLVEQQDAGLHDEGPR